MSDIKTVGVLGCGLMGAGIAQVASMQGFRTIVREVEQAVIEDRVELGVVTLPVYAKELEVRPLANDRPVPLAVERTARL